MKIFYWLKSFDYIDCDIYKKISTIQNKVKEFTSYFNLIKLPFEFSGQTYLQDTYEYNARNHFEKSR